jgi:hypothetical protein
VRSNGNVADAPEQSAAMPFAISTGPVTAVTLAADKVAPQRAGTTITWTATATGGIAPLQYGWLVFDGNTWSVGRDWGTSNTFAWMPTTANANYLVGVWVKSNGNVADAPEKDAAAAFPILHGGITAVTLAADKTAPQRAGTTITWTATATGGSAPLQCKWRVFDGNTWSVARDWGTSNTFAWMPTTANANYVVSVWVRSNGNVADAPEQSAAMSFAISPGPVTAVTLAADKVAPQRAGTTITWTATATGGIAPLQYKWLVFDGNTWRVARDWGTANTFAWRPTKVNANYVVRVWIRSNGNVADAPEQSAAMPFAIRKRMG